MEEEEIPPWDWRRTQMLEAALVEERQKNAVLRADLEAANEIIRFVQSEQGRIKMRVDKIETDIVPKPMLPMVIPDAE